MQTFDLVNILTDLVTPEVLAEVRKQQGMEGTSKMAYAQPVLGIYTLPHISGYEETREFRGAMVEMADSTVHFDNVNSSPKRTFCYHGHCLLMHKRLRLSLLMTLWQLSYFGYFTIPSGPTPATTTVTRTEGALKFTPVKAVGWSTLVYIYGIEEV